jgi:glycosyltransferase involved in cell wall biosynthesis
MKIGFFTDSYPPSLDGVATSVESSARQLQKMGHTVYVVAPDQPHGKDRKNVYRLVSIRLMKTPDIRVGLQIPQPNLFKIAGLEVDIIHGHSGGPVSLLGWQVARLHNIPFIETYHTLFRYYRHYLPYQSLLKIWMIKRITAFIGNDCDAIIAPTLKAKKDLLTDGVKKPIYIVPSGVYTEKFDHVKKGWLLRKYNIPQAQKILLTVGRLEKEKSIDFLVRVYSQLFKAHRDTALIIVGVGRDKEKLQKLAVSLGVNENIHFIGHVTYSNMPKVYADADIFIFASRTETQGMVITEAIASGIPVVAVADDAFTAVITNNANGFLVPKEANTFALKLSNILKDKELKKRLSRNAKQSARQFSIESTAKNLEHVYSEVVMQKKKKN